MLNKQSENQKKRLNKSVKKRPGSLKYSQLIEYEKKKNSPYKNKNKLVSWTQKSKKSKNYL